MTIIGSGDNDDCTSVIAKLFHVSPYFNRTVAPLPDRLLVSILVLSPLHLQCFHGSHYAHNYNLSHNGSSLSEANL